MRVLIIAVGSRGEADQLTGLETALRGAGHDISVVSYGTFEELIAGCGLARGGNGCGLARGGK